MTSTTTTGRRIVVAVDGSISSQHAALWAADEAAQRHEPLRLAHSADNRTFAYGTRLAPSQALFDGLQAEGRRVLSEVRAAVLDRHPGLDVTVALHTSGPVAAMLEESDTALIVVVGSRGTGGFPGIVVGSTAVAVAEHARSPVAVVRGHHADEAPPTTGPSSSAWTARPPVTRPSRPRSTRRRGGARTSWPCTPGPPVHLLAAADP
jgi:nucleotide-binding universal stress UspA family protein